MPNLSLEAVSDAVKITKEYGLSVGRAIEQEWFNKDNNGVGKFFNSREECDRLRLYARGEQPTQKYKDDSNDDIIIYYTLIGLKNKIEGYDPIMCLWPELIDK